MREIYNNIGNIKIIEGKRIIYVNNIITIYRRNNLLKH